VSGRFHAPVALTLRKQLRYTLDRSLGGPQSWSGRRGEEKIDSPPGLELQSLGRTVRNLLPCPGSIMNEILIKPYVSG
jgi:hypothetical protein